MERQAHVPARRLAFMPAWSHLQEGMGLTALRYTGRLMPLLLEWLHAYDRRSRVSALRLLGGVVRATWPRVAAHAGTLWGHLLAVMLRASGEQEQEGAGGESDRGWRRREEEGEGEGEEEAECAREVCGLLLACAREQVAEFRPEAAGLAAGAERLHHRLLAGDCGPAA